MKKYLVTNLGEGTVTLMGVRRVEIPGGCVDMEMSLPEESAKATVSRLKQRYPLLKISDANTKPEKAPVVAETKAPEAPVQEEVKEDAKTAKKK